MKTLFADIVSRIDFSSLPDEFSTLLDGEFSDNKKLFDYQKEALENALKWLWVYYENFPDEIKNLNSNLYKLYREEKRDSLSELDFRNEKGENFSILREYFPILLNTEGRNDKEYVSFENFVNRMGFWMATASGKSLVIIKLLSIVHKLKKDGQIPEWDFLFLAPKPEIINQVKDHIAEFNSYHKNTHIRLVELKWFEREKRDNRTRIWDEIVLYYTKSNLITDKESQEQMDYRNYENDGKWYIFLDEAHKGDKESSKAQQFYNIMARNGFIFNFSATFTDPRDINSTIYNLNLAEFTKKWYWKKIVLSESEYREFNRRNDEEYTTDDKKRIVLKSLITFATIKRFSEGISSHFPDGYHNPLMVTIWNSVYTEDSDLEVFFRELKEIWEWKLSTEDVRQAKEELLKEADLLTCMYVDSTDAWSSSERKSWKDKVQSITLKDLLETVYNSSRPGDIEYQTIIWNDKEIVFKLKSAEIPFALIKIGSISNWKNEKLQWYSASKTPYSEHTFDTLGLKNSPINILLGATSFYEGWDSNRPNVINFVNMGMSDAQKFVLQTIGRWVRIEPMKHERRRWSYIGKNLRFSQTEEEKQKIYTKYDNKIKNEIFALESLFLFSTKKEEMKNIIEGLDSEAKMTSEEFPIWEYFQKNKDISIPLYHPKYRDSWEAKKKYQINRDEWEECKQYIEEKWDILLLLDNWISTDSLSLLKNIVHDEKKYLEFPDKRDRTEKRQKYLILELISFFTSQGQILDDIPFWVVWDDVILSFSKISLTIPEKKQREDLIDKIKTSAKKKIHDTEESIDALFDQWKIDKTEYKKRLKAFENAKHTNDSSFLYWDTEILIKNIAEHYYNPLLVSDNEKTDFIKHIITVQSEKDFIEGLETIITELSEKYDNWYFSKLDQYLDKKIYIPYIDEKQKHSSFIPDFIFWLKKWDDYIIHFIDPKGTAHSNYTHKVDGYKRLFCDNDGTPTSFPRKDGGSIQVQLSLYNHSQKQPNEGYGRWWKNSVRDCLL